MRHLLVLGLVCGFTGCVFNNVSATERLRDSVVGLNDEARWNRFDLATQRVAPGFAARYRATHRRWHRDFQIADSEIVNVEIADGRAKATSFVTVRWYDHRTMLLAETTLKQQWRRAANGYVLIDEEVVEGNDRLLETPQLEPADETVEVDEPESPEVAQSS